MDGQGTADRAACPSGFTRYGWRAAPHARPTVALSTRLAGTRHDDWGPEMLRRRQERREGRDATRYQMRQRVISIGDDYVIENDRGERVFKSGRQGPAGPQDIVVRGHARARTVQDPGTHAPGQGQHGDRGSR